MKHVARWMSGNSRTFWYPLVFFLGIGPAAVMGPWASFPFAALTLGPLTKKLIDKAENYIATHQQAYAAPPWYQQYQRVDHFHHFEGQQAGGPDVATNSEFYGQGQGYEGQAAAEAPQAAAPQAAPRRTRASRTTAPRTAPRAQQRERSEQPLPRRTANGLIIPRAGETPNSRGGVD